MSRREGDTILIGDEIEIVIAHIGRTRVKVGIRAPRSVPVIAKELKLVRDENRAAAANVPSKAAVAALITQLQPGNDPDAARLLRSRGEGSQR
jgi:carbon storage regulator